VSRNTVLRKITGPGGGGGGGGNRKLNCVVVNDLYASSNVIRVIK
jgi:hypothetical protein